MPALSMPLFVSPNDVIERMQLNPDLSGVTDVISTAIIGAELHVETLLGGKLERTSQDCMYFLDAEAFSGIQPGGVFRLELPSSFIRRDTAPVVTLSSVSTLPSFNIFQAGGGDGPSGPFGSMVAANSALYRFDYDRGYLLMDANSHKNKYVRVRCDTGFEPGTNPLPTTGVDPYDANTAYSANDIVSYNGISWIAKISSTGQTPAVGTYWAKATIAIEQIPQRLYEAIMCMVPPIFDMNQNTNRSQEAVPQYQKASDHALQLLKDYMRMKGFTFRPIWSDVGGGTEEVVSTSAILRSPQQTPDGSRVLFTFVGLPAAGFLILLNGLVQSSEDYTVNGIYVVFNNPPSTMDTIQAFF